jgi:hypothetical protein
MSFTERYIMKNQMIKKQNWLIVVLVIMVGFCNGAFSQTLPWADDFEDGNMQGWTIKDDEPYTSGPSNWLVSNGQLLQTSNIFTTANEYSVFKGTHIFGGNSDWTDYYFVVRIFSGDDDGIGMVFRYQDENNYYRFLTVEDPNNRGPFKRLEKQVNGQFTMLAQSTSNIKIPGDFVGKIHVVGDSIYVYENNELLFAVKDNKYTTGKIGLMCYANNGAIFDDVYVSEQDTIYEDKAEAPDPDILTANRKLNVRALTFNIWVNGKICTPVQVAELIESLDLDFAGLQECGYEFGNAVSDLTGMYLAAGFDCFLLSKTPYTKINPLNVKGINAWTNIDSQTVSVYNFHIGWDESGDRSARTMVDEIFSEDPVPLQIAIGDFNDEHYSTQITILEEHMRYCLSDLGWAPSQRVTWPAFDFYGGEGAQTIDLIFCNKESKGRAIEGEILNTSPLLSDHKPVWATVEFPANKTEIGPQLINVTPYIDAEKIDLWFDLDLDSETANNAANYQVTSLDGGVSVSVLQAIRLKDVRRVRLVTTPHEYDKQYQITVSNVTDEFGVPVMVSSAAKEYTMYQNLIKNFGAEESTNDWEIFGGFTAVSERENQYPYIGSYFFTGENLQDLSTGTQEIDLFEWSEEIDENKLAAEWNCYFATGYELLGEIKASRCEPYDEAEMIVDFVDENGAVLSQASSKRWDTLFWHPYGETSYIPAGTRRAIVHLSSYRKTKNGLSNDAMFENVFFSVKQLDHSHNSGKNLLVNPSAETGDMTGWTVDGSLRARAHEDNKARPVSGYYLFSNNGITSGNAIQTFDFNEYSEKIDAGYLYVKWGGYMRDYRGDSKGEIKIEFYDTNKTLLDAVTTGEQKVAEWWLYDSETSVPVGTRSINYKIVFDAIANEGIYFDFLHFIPIDKSISSVSLLEKSKEFRLLQNYPNPFNAGTSIDYGCLYPGQVQLTIYNLIGQKIITLIDEFQNAGVYKMNWDGKDSFGNVVPSGVYVYKLITTDFIETRKMLMLR